MDFFNILKDKKLIILIIVISFILLLLSINGYLLWNNLKHQSYKESDEIEIALVEDKKVEDITKNKFFVEVKGAVKNAGVYEVFDSNIINDVIKLAGGLNKNAYTNNINLSKKLSPEMVIYIFTKSEYENLKKDKEEVKEVEIKECICPEVEIKECIENGQSEIIVNNDLEQNDLTDKNTIVNNSDINNEENVSNKENIDDTSSKNEEVKENLININTASIDELMTLSGIGESKAKAIIEYREKSKFKTIEEIKNISGIGDSVFGKIKEFITV